MQSLENIRSRINIIDKQILELLIERTSIAKDVAEYKYANGLPIVDTERENEILSKIPEKYRDIWVEMMHLSKQEQVLFVSELRGSRQ